MSTYIALVYQMPIIIIVKMNHQFTGKQWVKVWCPLHNDYEEIKEFTEDGLVTVSNCRLSGLIAAVEKSFYQTHWHYDEDPVRTTIRYTLIKDEAEYCSIVEETAHILFGWEKKTASAFFGALEFLPVPHILFIDNRYIPASPTAGVHEAVLKHIFPDLPPHGAKEKKPIHSQHDEQAILEEEMYYDSAFDPALESHEWECNINGYNFRQIKSITMFQNINRYMEAPWFNQQELTGKTLFAMERDGRYIALLKLNGNIMEYSSLHTFNDHILTAKSRAAMLIWMQRNNIHEKYDNLDEDCRFLENQPIHIQPLTEYAPWDIDNGWLKLAPEKDDISLKCSKHP